MFPKITPVRAFTTLACAAWASVSLASIANAQAAKPATAEAFTNLIFCNKSTQKIYLALVYLETRTQKWMLTAWLARNPGECKSAGKFRSGVTYYYARNEAQTMFWPATAKVDKTFCVPPAQIERVQLGGTCAAGEKNVGFHGINATGATFTFNLN
jgi:hypothetical protein